jgi:hypothetical protein
VGVKQAHKSDLTPLYVFIEPSSIEELVVFHHLVITPFYDVRVDRVERVQRWFNRYALRGLSWTNMHDLPLYEDRCALLHLDTPAKRRSIACMMFIFDVLSGRVNSPNLLSVLDLITPQYPTRGTEISIERTMEFMYPC